MAVYGIFGGSKDYGFKDQICRAAVSVSNNVAEGFDRGSDADFTRFLNIARTSCHEAKSMAYLARRLDYINENQKNGLIGQTEETSKIIYGLIQSLNSPK